MGLQRLVLGLAGMTFLVVASACSKEVDGLVPVGGDEPSPIQQERFIRRLHLDVNGLAPPDNFTQSSLQKLAADGDNPNTRAALADELIQKPEFATVFVDDVDNRTFAGEGYESRYALLCSNIRNFDPACQACAPSTDPCADCSCQALVDIRADRQGLMDAAANLMDGTTTTSDIERRFAASMAFYQLQDANTTTMSLFEQFLHRPAEPEELENGASMVAGLVLTPGAPAGLIFHTHGSSYQDLVDIVFGSEIYREAIVGAVFERYLGRPASAAELAHFTSQLDEQNPDIRDVVRQVVSSGEYYEQ